MIIGAHRPGWLDAEQCDRLGPWLPPRRVADRRVIGIVCHGYRRPLHDQETGHWRRRDAVLGRVALERVDGLSLVRVHHLSGDILARRLGEPRARIAWLVCLVRGDLARPIPGAWALSHREALARCPDRWHP